MSLIYRNYRESLRQTIHADSQRDVADIREQMGLLMRSQPNGDASVRHRRGDRDYTCPVCMDEARFSVETNCGHVFCGQYICFFSDSGPLSQRAAITKVRYRKDPHMQNSMHKLKLTLTLVLTLADTGGAVLTLMLGYRSLYITWQQRPFSIAVLCDSGPLR